MITKLISLKPIRYLLAGGSAFLVEYLTFLNFYYSFDVSLVYSNVLSFVAGLITSFTLNKLWVFNANTAVHRTKKQFSQYMGLALTNLALSTIGIKVLVELNVPAGIAKFIFIALIAVWNYLIFKKFIFKSH